MCGTCSRTSPFSPPTWSALSRSKYSQESPEVSSVPGRQRFIFSSEMVQFMCGCEYTDSSGWMFEAPDWHKQREF